MTTIDLHAKFSPNPGVSADAPNLVVSQVPTEISPEGFERKKSQPRSISIPQSHKLIITLIALKTIVEDLCMNL